MWAAIAVGIALSIAGPAGAAADDDDDPAQSDGAGTGAAVLGRSLVAVDATWQVAWATTPALTAQLGPTLLGALDEARGGPPAPSVFGTTIDRRPPPSWPLALPGAITGAAPLGPAGCARCATRFPLADQERIAAAWALTHFTLDPGDAEVQGMRVLELRARYRDGLVVWLNGLPVVRRELAVEGDPLAIATRLHGPEWESVFIPVVPGLLRAGDNVLAVEVRPAAHQRAPELELVLAGRGAGRVVRGPMVQAVGADRATIVVETDVPTVATLRWGATALDHERTAARADRRHTFALDGLPRDAAIRYQVAIDGAAVATAQFATTPGPGAVVRLGVYGDVRGGHRIHAALVARLLDEAPDAVLVSGDLVLRGSDEADWQQFFAVTAPLLSTIPYYPAVGNHDLGRAGDLGRRFEEHFALPPGPPDRPPGAEWYSFDVGDVHVAMLDSNNYDDPRQRAWIEADLLAADGARAIVIVTHDGPYSRGTHGGNQQAVRDYVPILVRHRVTLLVSGHDHLYQRGAQDGLTYVVSGGGGAPLYRARCGVPGRGRCVHPDGMLALERANHYLIVTIYPGHVELCAKAVDGAPLEPCVRLPTRR